MHVRPSISSSNPVGQPHSIPSTCCEQVWEQPALAHSRGAVVIEISILSIESVISKFVKKQMCQFD